MSNAKMDFGAAFNFGIERFKGNPGLSLSFGGAVLIIALAFGLVVMLIVQLMTLILMKISPMLVFTVLPVELLLFAVSNGVVMAAFVLPFFTCLEKESRGEKSDFLEEVKVQKHFKEAFIAAFGSYLLSSIGICLCVLPGLALMPLLPLSLYLVWKGDKGLDALKKSFRILYDNMLGGLFLLIAMIASGIGLLLCLVGVIATLSISFAAALHLCGQMTKGKDEIQPAS